jgi:hypothetical protein
VTDVLCSSATRTAFVAGFSGKSYPNLIELPNYHFSHDDESGGSSGRTGYLKIKNPQIRCAAASPSGNLVAFLDNRDVLNLVDLRPSVPVQVLGEWSRERRGADHNEEGAAIAMLSDEEIYIFCIRRAQPVFVRLPLGGAKRC